MGCSRQKGAVGAWRSDGSCGVSSARCCASAARPERLHSDRLTRTSGGGLIEDVPAASQRTSAGLRAMNNPGTLRRSPLGMFPGQPTPRLYDRVVEVLRTRHYSRRTEQACIHWIRRFILISRPRASARPGRRGTCFSLSCAGTAADPRRGRGSTGPTGWRSAPGLHAPVRFGAEAPGRPPTA